VRAVEAGGMVKRKAVILVDWFAAVRAGAAASLNHQLKASSRARAQQWWTGGDLNTYVSYSCLFRLFMRGRNTA